MTDEHLDKPERRSFMKGMAAAGGAAVLAGLADEADAASDQGTAQTRGQSNTGGYRLTPHVRDYYRTLRF